MLAQSSIAGTNTWTTLDAPQEQWDQLALVGPSTIYLDGTSTDGFPGTDLWRSTNGGATWSHLGDPCAEVPLLNPGPSTTQGRGDGIAAVGTTVAVACASGQIAPQQAGYEQGVVLSDDEGNSFSQFLPVPHLGGFDGSSGITAIALASPGTVVVVGSEGGVQTSFNGGRTWTTTIPQLTTYAGQMAAAGPIGFENSMTGHVVTPSNTFWTTTDGGRIWSAYRFPS